MQRVRKTAGIKSGWLPKFVFLTPLHTSAPHSADAVKTARTDTSVFTLAQYNGRRNLGRKAVMYVKSFHDLQSKQGKDHQDNECDLAPRPDLKYIFS